MGARLAICHIGGALRCHEPCEIGRRGAYFDHLRTNCKRRGTRWRSEIDSNSRSRWLTAERADLRDFPFSAWETDRRSARVGGTGEGPAACREPSNVCICPEKERAGTCVVRASRAGADHVASGDRVEDRSHGRVSDVRDGSRIRSHQDARETQSRAAGAELRGP